MIRRISFPLITMVFFLVPLVAKAAERNSIGSVSVSRENSLVTVNAELELGDSSLTDLSDGMQKEFIFYLDLFRVWSFWPDEFIHGIKIAHVIKSNPVKKEFTLKSRYGESVNEQRFNSLDSLLPHALKIENIQAFTIEGLPVGQYYVRVTVESRIRKLAPIVGYLLFFVPEKEFTVWKNSAAFEVVKR
jgi:hypothetical protein